MEEKIKIINAENSNKGNGEIEYSEINTKEEEICSVCWDPINNGEYDELNYENPIFLNPNI